MTIDQFTSLATGYLAELYGYAGRLVRGRADAEDLVQDTYERAFGAWRQLRDPAAIRAWLFRIMLTIFLNERRQASRYPLLEPASALDDRPDPAPPLDDTVALRFEIEALEVALARLPHTARQLVLLADFWGLSYAEMATILDCPVGTVRSGLHRARARLAREVAGPGAQAGQEVREP